MRVPIANQFSETARANLSGVGFDVCYKMWTYREAAFFQA